MKRKKMESHQGRQLKWLIVVLLCFVCVVVTGFVLLRVRRASVYAHAQKELSAAAKGSGATNINSVDWYATLGTNVNRRMPGGRTPLILAAMSGQTDEARELIEKGADVNLSDNSGRTALWFAADGDENIELVRLLIEHGANVNAKDKNGASVLDMAQGSTNPHAKLVELLRRVGATSQWDKTQQ